MPHTDIPTNPTKSPFGYPRPERLEAFRTAKESASGATNRVTLQGQVRDFPIIKVRINVPKYRME